MMRLVSPFCALVLLATCATALAAPCDAPRQLKLHWDAAKDQGQLTTIAYGCTTPTSCPVAAGTTATKLPIHVKVSSGDTTLFETDVENCAGGRCRSLNSSGCAGGGDAHKGDKGLVKVGYPRKGGASVMARLRAPMPKLPEVSGPVQLQVTDASGYVLDATFARCRSNSRETSAVLVCR
jgi:hypothetical protein